MTDTAAPEALVAETTIRLAASGDEAAFARLVAEHHRAMVRVAYVVAGDPETAGDAVQSAWAIAWQRLRTLRDPAQVRPWLVAVAANEARQTLRRQRRRAVVELSVRVEDAPRDDPADSIDLIDLGRVLHGLKPDDRALLALRYVAGLDSSQIAAQMGLSASGVRTRLARLLDRLRTDLER